jgi:Xaa-Pro aminopeptidase
MISISKKQSLEGLLQDDTFLLIVWSKESRRNGDIMYPFRQNSSVLLLTWVSSPDIVVTCKKHEWVCEWKIFSDPLSDHEKLWWSERLSYDEITQYSGIESVLPLFELLGYIDSSMNTTQSIYTHQNIDNPYLENLLEYNCEMHGISELLDPLRMIKTDEEIDCMRRAIQVTHQAFNCVKEKIQPGMYEYEIEALIAWVFRSHHLTEAYPTIVASGINACTLHYMKHTRRIEEGDLVLIDFGAEYMGYAADITRVFAVGMPNSRQRMIHESVSRVKNFAQSILRPGIKKTDYEVQVREKMNIELEKLWLISSSDSQEEREKLSRKYYPHSTSHFLGLDVHDVGSREAILEIGMVVTCEPGIYIREEWIGIRLEDDILITENGCENLSQEIPCILEK